MATRALAAGALAGALMLGALGCSDDDGTTEPQPATITFAEVNLELDVPSQLADLTYAMGEAEEGQPALYFSTDKMASVGGPSCAAGATAAVSPYPLGQIVVSEETPEHVREEARENPEENLGTFVTRVGEHYIYYLAPPEEPCVSDDEDATVLQRQLTTDLKDALPTLRSTE